MKKIFFLVFTLLPISSLTAQSNDDGQKQQTVQQEEKKCFFGRCNKSKAFLEEHYQTGPFSATRMWLALFLGYEVDQEGKNKALQIAANRGDDKKVKILTAYGANPQEALALATHQGYYKTSKILHDRGAKVQPKELKALQGCFLGCFKGNPERTKEHLQQYSQCKEIAGLFRATLAKSNEEYARDNAKQEKIIEKYAKKLKTAEENSAELTRNIKYNKAYQGNLEVLHKQLDNKLIETFDAMRVKVKEEPLTVSAPLDRAAQVFLQGLSKDSNFC